MSLLYFASQLGRKMSKFSFVESEYFRAIKVSGQNILKISSTRPSPTTNPIAIQVKTVIWLVSPEYTTKKIINTKNNHTRVCRSLMALSLLSFSIDDGIKIISVWKKNIPIEDNKKLVVSSKESRSFRLCRN